LIVLIASMALPALFKLVGEEIGERKKKNPIPRRWAIGAFAILAIYLGARSTLHSKAIDLLQSAISDPDTLSGLNAVAPGALRGEVAQLRQPEYLQGEGGAGSAPTLGSWGDATSAGRG